MTISCDSTLSLSHPHTHTHTHTQSAYNHTHTQNSQPHMQKNETKTRRQATHTHTHTLNTTNKGINSHSKDVTQTQQRPKPNLIGCASKYNKHKLCQSYRQNCNTERHQWDEQAKLNRGYHHTKVKRSCLKKKRTAEKTPTSQIPGWLANTSYYIHLLGVFFFSGGGGGGGGAVFNFLCIPFLSKDLSFIASGKISLLMKTMQQKNNDQTNFVAGNDNCVP